MSVNQGVLGTEIERRFKMTPKSSPLNDRVIITPHVLNGSMRIFIFSVISATYHFELVPRPKLVEVDMSELQLSCLLIDLQRNS